MRSKRSSRAASPKCNQASSGAGLHLRDALSVQVEVVEACERHSRTPQRCGHATASSEIDASEALEQGSVPREVTSEHVGIVYLLAELLAARAMTPEPATVYCRSSVVPTEG